MILYQLRNGVVNFLYLLQGVLVVYCVLSWFMDSRSPVMRFLTRVTHPILQPIRMVLFRSTSSYRSSGFAPLIAVFLIQLLNGFLLSL